MNTKIPLIFFGTHEFAKTILEGLLQSPLYDVELVVTQPDQPVGRKKIMTAPPVKILAEKNNIPVVQPETLKNYIFQNKKSSIGVVAQYGKIIPQSVLDQFELGLINTHTSLLPKYRGASPIQSALMNGETETGVSIMLLDEGMDTGPLLAQKSVDILPDETYLELDTKLAIIASELLLSTIEPYVRGKIKPQPQENTEATPCRLLSRDDGRIDWKSMNATEIYNQYRGLTPWPGVWTTL
ncbi:MAG: methionyl-tRNA formyltransferase, partial [Candidatus Magasanikbacteria bacterium]